MPLGLSPICATLAGAVLSASAAGAQPSISLHVVSMNDIPVLPPGTNVAISPGDEIVIEVFASDWSPNQEELRAWEVTVDPAGFSNGLRGTLRPRAGRRPCSRTACTDLFLSENCQCADLHLGGGAGSVCGKDGFCTDPEDTAPCAAGVFIDPAREDFVFFAAPASPLLITQVLEGAPRVAGVLTVADGLLFAGKPRYLATVVLVASQDTEIEEGVCGPFEVAPLPPPRSALLDQDGFLIPNLELRGLVLDATDACCIHIVDARPPNCVVDAGQPHGPHDTEPLGPTAIELTFNCSDASELPNQPEVFEVTQAPPGLAPPEFTLEHAGGSIVRLNFAQVLEARSWTCVALSGGESVEETCVGVLPGDADGDGENTDSDVTRVIDCLAGKAEAQQCLPFNCDIDRSGRCAPADLPRIIDLFKGADAFDRWFEEFIGDDSPIGCPSE